MDKSTPIQILRDEHVTARRILYVLESLAKRLRKKEPVSLLKGKELIEVIRIAMESHHQKEMDIFPFLVENEQVTKKELLDALAEEHELGHEYLSNVLRIIDHKNKEAGEKYQLLPFHLEKYTELLKAHIEKEEQGFFPLVKASVSLNNQDALLESFKKTSNKFNDKKSKTMIASAAARR